MDLRRPRASMIAGNDATRQNPPTEPQPTVSTRETPVTNAGLGGRASRGAAVTMGGQLARIVVQMVGVIILARLLAPDDYGLLAMVTAIVGAGEILRDFGLGMAAIQSRSLSKDQRNNLFWINSGIGLVIASIVFAASWLIAGLYGDDRLLQITQVMSSIFVLNGLASQYRAHLQRSLKFTWLAVTEVTSLAVGIVTGVAMALAGFGYWSLVGQQVGQALVALVLVAIASRWLPGAYRRSAPMRELLQFGWNLVASQLLIYASKNTDSVVIGLQFGAGPLGLYNRAFQLLTLPLNQLNAPATRVAVPVLSRLQDETSRFSQYLLTGQTAILHVILAIFALLCALAEPVVSVLLGPQWAESVPLFRILSIAGVFQAAGYATLWGFLSLGLTRANLHFSLLTRPLLIGAVIVGAFWGIEGVAWGYAVGMAFTWPIGLLWLRRVSDAPVRAMFLNGVRGTVAYAIAGAAAYLLASWLLPTSGDVVRLVGGALAMLIVLGVEFLVWPAFRRDIRMLLKTIRLMRK
ncbi:lipopolysaccharide biosynthesis protein [Plantibacter flavus]|uniref:lipopolysaccharide biosynthesis protein n=1 Tax=Plantibacter flavus TaxID=150123 RepID=UPI0033931F58